MTGLLLPAYAVAGLLRKENVLVVIFIAVFASILPDLYHPRVRRNPFLHSIIGGFLASYLFSIAVGFVYYTFLYRSVFDTADFAFKIVFPSYLLHLLGDSLTGGGIYPSYPFTSRRFRIYAYRYDDPALNRAGAGLGLLVGSLALLSMFFEEIHRVLYP